MGRISRRDLGKERRQFVRLPYVLPVEFYLVSGEHNQRLSDLIQGFTRNVSRGGLCLEVNNLKERLALLGLSGKAKLLLYINLPFSHHPVEIYGQLIWVKKANAYPHKFLLGVSYLNPALPEAARPIRFARSIRYFNRIIAVFIILLFLGLASVASSNVVLRKTNKKLVEKLVKISEEGSKVSQKIFHLEDLKEVLEAKLKETKLKIYDLAHKENKETKTQAFSPEKLRKAYEDLEDLEKKLKVVEEGEILLQNQLGEIKEKRTDLEGKTLEKMYHWLEVRQNRETGLVRSYDGDPTLEDWAFTYDQALAAQCFLLFKDFKSAQKILDFYRKKAAKVEGGLANVYDATSGYVIEYIVHTGPNIWLGLSVLKYIDITGDKSYLPFVEEIANWILALQNEDPEGGIKGGPKMNWFSTEHNLDAYAFLNNLYKITKNKKYQEASQKILSWLKTNAYLKTERRFKRGKGDATIATDTLAWAIATLGPKLLRDEGMDPEGILEFAEENCQVTVTYLSPSGSQGEITGFDFAKARNIGRGGVISSEWTAQMVVAFKIMSNFYLQENNLKKAKIYQDKAEFFLIELDKLIISRPSKTGQGAICLPYASHQNVDTGHGWRTPRGRNTGCVAGTVYAIFAKKDFNPFEIR